MTTAARIAIQPSAEMLMTSAIVTNSFEGSMTQLSIFNVAERIGLGVTATN